MRPCLPAGNWPSFWAPLPQGRVQRTSFLNLQPLGHLLNLYLLGHHVAPWRGHRTVGRLCTGAWDIDQWAKGQQNKKSCLLNLQPKHIASVV